MKDKIQNDIDELYLKDLVWGRDFLEYIYRIYKVYEKNNIVINNCVGIGAPEGTGKFYIINSLCNKCKIKCRKISFEDIFNSYCDNEEIFKDGYDEFTIFYIYDMERILSSDYEKIKCFYNILYKYTSENNQSINCIFVFSFNNIINNNLNKLLGLKMFIYGGLSTDEKLMIADRIIEKNKRIYKFKNIRINKDTIKKLILEYTLESGINNLKKMIDDLFIYSLYKNDKDDDCINEINLEEVKNIFGSEKVIFDNELSKIYRTGVGLAWTKSGGIILPIIVKMVSGSGNYNITGTIGSSMKESIEIVLEYFKVNFKKLHITIGSFNEYDFFINIPPMTMPTDGPSAGIAFFTNIYCYIKKIYFKEAVALTGEISLDGRILRVGGLKEKLSSAIDHNFKIIILPVKSKPEYERLPSRMRSMLKAIFVDNVLDLIEIIDKYSVEEEYSERK